MSAFDFPLCHKCKIKVSWNKLSGQHAHVSAVSDILYTPRSSPPPNYHQPQRRTKHEAESELAGARLAGRWRDGVGMRVLSTDVSYKEKELFIMPPPPFNFLRGEEKAGDERDLEEAPQTWCMRANSYLTNSAMFRQNVKSKLRLKRRQITLQLFNASSFFFHFIWKKHPVDVLYESDSDSVWGIKMLITSSWWF